MGSEMCIRDSSRLYSNNSMGKFSDAMNWSIRIACTLIIPAAIGLFVLAEPIIAAIFYGGMFDSHDVFLTALSLKAFSFGLIGFLLSRFFLLHILLEKIP